MAFTNNVMIVRHGLLAKIVKMWKDGSLVEKIDYLPVELSPRNSEVRGRCCVHKERAVWKYKSFPLLGFDMTDEESEITPLSEYAKKAMARRGNIKENILCVMDEACSSCVQTNYEISNLCRGCVARSCYMNCPKDAIQFKANGKAEIMHDKCISCGICHNSCPYHAIIYVPIPCEEACPVKAISKDENGIEKIDETKCIYCGKCVNACPFGAIFEISNVIDILEDVRDTEQKVVAMIAPAVLSQFNTSLESLYGAFKEMGFDDVIEVALGADETTRNESHELLEKLEEGQPFMTTSCCPSYIQLAKKHLPGMERFISSTGSPMYYTAKIAKEKYPNAKTVFVGPCIAKRKEAQENPDVDYVLTFEELGSLLAGFEIDLKEVAPFRIDQEAYLSSHGYGQTGGVTAAVQKHIGDKHTVNGLLVSGFDKKSINLLKAYGKSGKCPNEFIEVMACENGCISGPVTKIDKATAARAYVKELANMAKARTESAE